MTLIREMPFKERNLPLWDISGRGLRRPNCSCWAPNASAGTGSRWSKFHPKVLEQNMQLQQGKEKSMALLIFPARVLRQDLYCAVGVSGSLDSGRKSFFYSLWCLQGLVIPHSEAKTWPAALEAVCGFTFSWELWTGKRLMLPQSLEVHWEAAPWTAVPRLRGDVLEEQDWNSAVWVVTLCCDQMPRVQRDLRGGCRTCFLIPWQFCWKLLSVTSQTSFLCRNSLIPKPRRWCK